ncbi:hypothetical protein CCAX7_46190 [Capsulimonas corticalis]|uniref:Uncharacterized protein n=1 Tax=Capsulimonas corticalis TaxID=2219043 RepID=A0A402D513_9BACT|nr:type IV secretory system conjugative DNA transfer family protein [Capsulimonas corticalis]BDI32568.1 hypothetical protein CCAX7_46190 [Capsulimonas corticalis]
MPENEFLKALRESPDSPYYKIKAEHQNYLSQQRRIAAERQQALIAAQNEARARQLEDAAAAEKKRQRHFQEQQNMLDAIEEAKHRRWMHEPNTLLLGTVRGHPLEGLRVPVPDHLHDLYHDRNHQIELPIWFRGDEMGLTFGATGSGKFTGIIAANAMYFDGGLFVVDPKGEVCAVTGNARRKKFQKVYRLDPFDVTEFAPDAYQVPRASFNPLDALNSEAKHFDNDVCDLVEIIVTPHKDGGDGQFFIDQAKTLLTALIMFVCASPLFDGQRHLAKVHELLCVDAAHLIWLLEEMAQAPQDAIRLCATAHQGMTEKTRSGVWSQAQNDMSIFSRGAIKESTSHSTFDLAELFEGKITVYLVLPSKRLDSNNRWLRLIMATFLMEAGNRKERGATAANTLWLVDEARQLGALSSIPQAYRLLRSYGIRMWTFWQSLQDLQQTYPDDWSSMLDNSFVQLLSCNSLDTAKYFSELAGEYREGRISTSEAHGVNSSENSSVTHGSSGSGGISRGPQGTTSSWNSGGSSSRTTGTSHGTSFTESTTRSWQWDKRIRIDDILTMASDRIYLRCPRERAGFVNKHMYFDNAFLAALASGNPLYGGPRPKPLFPPLSLEQTTEDAD